MNVPLDEHIADYIGLDERLRLGECVREITSCGTRNKKKHRLPNFKTPSSTSTRLTCFSLSRGTWLTLSVKSFYHLIVFIDFILLHFTSCCKRIKSYKVTIDSVFQTCGCWKRDWKWKKKITAEVISWCKLQFSTSFLSYFITVYLWTVEKWHFVAIFDSKVFRARHLICSAYL